jgi:hypothetical protein
MYEGVVFRSDAPTAQDAFGAISSSFKFRLVALADGVFGVYRVAGRTDAFDQSALESVAGPLSRRLGRAVALFYDNRCGMRTGILYVNGGKEREFGDSDAWWVPYGADGRLILDGPRFRVPELKPGEEYDCIFSAIDAGLDAVGSLPEVDASLVKQAFCYEKLGWLMESGSGQSRG